MSRNIVFAMIEAGGGHKAPAKAVMEALDSGFPGRYSTRLMDFIKDIGCEKIDATHKWGWNLFLGHPALTHMAFQLQDSFGPIARALLYRQLVAPALPAAIRFLRTTRPDAIFSSHFINTMLLAEARKRSGIDFTLYTYQTEIFTYHALWRQPESDWFITASDRAAQTAAENGIKWSSIRSFPYPVSPSLLSSRRDRQVIAEELGLEPGRKTILFSFGNQGAALVLQYLLTIELLSEPVNVVLVTGRNKALRRRMEAYRHRFSRVNFIPLGFVNNMNELIRVSDLCFIKPGPATTMECMHSRKPIIFGMAATPCEQAHANYAVARGVAKYADSLPLFAAALRHFLKDESRAEVERRYKELDLKNGAADIAAFIDQSIGSRK